MISRMITRADVEKLAVLSRIRLSDDENVELQKDMESILNYVRDIQSVSGVAVETKRPLHRNVMRADDEPHERGAYTDSLLKSAPRSRDGFLVVKKIL